MDELLTSEEHSLVKKLASLVSDFSDIMSRGAAHEGDMSEIVIHIHALQNMVLAQAAARAYPKKYRLM